MGISERKEREREEMRQSILDAAHKLFCEKGYDGVSIRNIAELIEYSPATIYLYYKDKNEIYYALQYKAAALKRDHLLPATRLEDPWERLVDLGKRYIDFGLKHSDLYDLLFITKAPMESIENQECWSLGLATHAFLIETVQACVDKRYFKSTDTETIAYTLWCHVHGMVSLFIRDRMRMYPVEKRNELAENSFKLLIKMAESL
ncbi:MAG: TetR/AcrR family transcriptional regulator [Saprospiraceae bacterium]